MKKIITLDGRYSTTKRIVVKRPSDIDSAAFFKDEYSLVRRLFLPKNLNRISEGGLRHLGYFKDVSEQPFVSVIIAVFNGEKYLENTIKSIVEQSYDSIELIVVDGGSNDGTLNILKKYDSVIDYWVSEPDLGISDAFNKGVSLSTGTYINFQGDGDGFCSKQSLENLLCGINADEDILVCGRIRRIDSDGRLIYVSKKQNAFNKASLLFKMSLPHQALFTNVSYFYKYGLFDSENVFCMDYEHLLRSYKEFPKIVVKDVLVANWRADGIGTGRELEIFKEYNKIKLNNRVAPKIVLKLINLWTLFKFFVKRSFL